MEQQKIAIYSRKSRFTGKGESIGNQIELCREYIRMTFGTVYAETSVVFEDEGFSGGNLNRPDFRNMMEAVRRQKFRAIVVYRLDRISRNISDFTNLIDELTKLGVSFISIREQFDTSTPMGRAMMFIISVFSQLERETIAERIRDNMHELAKTGRWLGGNTPTGFASESITTVEGKKVCKLRLIPEEAGLVRTIFDLYIETDSLTATETELLHRCLKSKTGRDLTRFAIKAILQNPVYLTADEQAWQYFTERGADVCAPKECFDGNYGIMAYNRTEQEKGRAAVELPVSEWIVAVGKHPGLIPSTQWIRVQESLERNKSKGYRKPRGNNALLTGLLFCTCGGRMYPKLSNRKDHSYVCKMKEKSKGTRCGNRNVNGVALDAAVLEQISRLNADRELLAERLHLGDQTQHEMRLSNLRREYAENEKKMTRLVDDLAILEEPAAKEQIARRIGQLCESNREIEQQIRNLETQMDALSPEEFDRQRNLLTEFASVTGVMTLEEKRAALRRLIQKVTWDGMTAQVILFGAEGTDGKQTEHTV